MAVHLHTITVHSGISSGEAVLLLLTKLKYIAINIPLLDMCSTEITVKKGHARIQILMSRGVKSRPRDNIIYEAADSCDGL